MLYIFTIIWITSGIIAVIMHYNTYRRDKFEMGGIVSENNAMARRELKRIAMNTPGYIVCGLLSLLIVWAAHREPVIIYKYPFEI